MKSQENINVKTINSVERALDILELLSSCSRPQTVTEISNQLEVNRVTTYNLLNTLAKRGYIAKTEDSKYSITSYIYELGTLYRNSFPVVHALEQNIPTLSNKYHCSIHLGIISVVGKGILLAAKSANNELIPLPEGYPIPLHATGIGKVLLAFAPESIKDSVLNADDLPKYTESTIVKHQDLQKELQNIVRDGFSVDRGEFTANMWCVAAPIYDNNSEVIAAVSFSTSKEIYHTGEADLIREVKIFAQRLSLFMGYHPLPKI